MTNLLFEPPFGGLRGNVRTSSIARWKARGRAVKMTARAEAFQPGHLTWRALASRRRCMIEVDSLSLRLTCLDVA